MAHSGSGEGGAEIFTTTTPLRVSGSMGYTVRVLPHHRLLSGDTELGLVTLA
jgi:starch phosphorylase